VDESRIEWAVPKYLAGGWLSEKMEKDEMDMKTVVERIDKTRRGRSPDVVGRTIPNRKHLTE
jgi:hypothetical protein